MSAALAYRPDIDGLRTIAILPVVLFHLGIAGVSGGFVGVDVFFVISGFLITSIIHNEMQGGSFSMKEFWVRRARRILPAMFVLIILTIAAGWFLLAPYDYAELGRSARYQALFAANIFFWQESGYFDTAAELKPLLHMWSLAVEEQFYFFFPLLLLLLKSVTARQRCLALVTIAVASFALSAWSISTYPSATFYLLPMRAWELMIGSLIVFIAPCAFRYRQSRDIVSITGLLAIIAAIVLFDAHTDFPGPAALLPTLGAGAIIWAGPGTIVARLLAKRPVVFIGLLSYSWYLWHWPLIVFTRYWQTEPLSLAQQTTLFCTSLLLAYLSYRFIENPFRQKKILSTNKKILIAAFCCILCTVLLGQQLRRYEGFPDRLPEQAQKYEAVRHRHKTEKRCEHVSAQDLQKDNICRLGTAAQGEPPLFVSYGDSHSGHYMPLYEAFAQEHHVSFWHTSLIGCSPLLSASDTDNTKCRDYNQAMLEFIKRHHIPNVILSSRWALFYGDEEDPESQFTFQPPTGISREDFYRRKLQDTVHAIRALGSNVWIVKQVPSHPFEPPKHFTMLAMQGKSTEGLGRSYQDHLDIHKVVNGFIDELAKEDGIYVLDATEILCSNHKLCITEKDGYSLYRDDNHLSTFGARYIKDMMTPVAAYLKGRQSGQP